MCIVVVMDDSPDKMALSSDSLLHPGHSAGTKRGREVAGAVVASAAGKIEEAGSRSGDEAIQSEGSDAISFKGVQSSSVEAEPLLAETPSIDPPILVEKHAESSPELSKIIAHVDGVDGEYVTGWAWVPDHPEHRVSVNAYHAAELVSFGTANVLRSDVRSAGFGDGLCGFRMPIPDELRDGVGRKFRLEFEATGAQTYSTERELTLHTRVERVSTVGRRPNNEVKASVPTVPALQPGSRPSAIYVPGQYIVCATPYPVPPYHTEGWCAPEREFTWIDGIEATIEMLLRRPTSHYTFIIDVVPNGVAGKQQTLEIFINFFRLGYFEVRQPMTLSLELPAEIFILRTTRINLHCREAVIPADHGVPDDHRRLGIAVSGWCIS